MGLLEFLTSKFAPKKAKTAMVTLQTLNGYRPVFTSFKGAIYENELVRASIDALARHSSKLDPVIKGSAKPTFRSTMKYKPNPLQTWSQFLYQTRTILENRTTVFIIPVLDRYGNTTGIYPLVPSYCEVLESDGQLWLKYQFASGKTWVIELEKCAIITRFQYEKEFFGSGNAALKDTMDLVHIQNQAINEGVKQSATIKFIAKENNLIDPEDLELEQNRFAKHIQEQEGFLLFPSTYDEIKQVESKALVIDAEQRKLINENVYNYFGVNEDILQNKAFGDAWSAFYEGGIEPFAIQMSQALTAMNFTQREQAAGSEFIFGANRLQYMSNADKLNMSIGMLDRGGMNRDEVREMWNLPPLPNGEGQAFIIRGEYYNSADKIEEGKEDADE